MTLSTEIKKSNPTIIVLHFGADIVRGSEVCLFRTLRILVEQRYRILLLRNNPVMDAEVKKVSQDIEVQSFDYPEIMFDGPERRFPIWRYLKQFMRLRRLVEEWKPQVLLCNSGLPCQLAVPIAKLSGVRSACHFHHPASKRYLYLWMVKFADHIFCPSQFTSNLVSTKGHVPTKTVYNTVDFSQDFTPDRSLDKRNELMALHGIEKQSIIIGQVAALVPIKRPVFLLEAFAKVARQFPQAHLVFVGKGSEQAAMERRIQELGLQTQVTLTGFVDSVVPYLRHLIDINALVSMEEGLGISVVEASGCALPSIGTDCTGLSEVIVHGKTGYKFDMDDQQAVVSALTRLLQDDQLRQSLGQQAREFALDRFAESNYREGILEAVTTA